MCFSNVHVVVFDGCTPYVIPASELQEEIEQNEVEVLEKFDDFDKAFEFCEAEMVSITNNGAY